MTERRHERARRDTMPAVEVDPDAAPTTPRVRTLADVLAAVLKELGVNGDALEGLRTYAEREEIASDERHAEHARTLEALAREFTGLRAAIGAIGAETTMVASWVEGAGPHLARTGDELVRLERRLEAVESAVAGVRADTRLILELLQAPGAALDTTAREEPE